MPASTDHTSTVALAMSRMPGTNTSRNLAPGAISAPQVSASQPFAIEPPETLEKIPIPCEQAGLMQPPQRAGVKQHRAITAAGKPDRPYGIGDAPRLVLRLVGHFLPRGSLD